MRRREFKIIANTNGQNTISIRGNSFGEYLYTYKPNIVSWYDCYGSVGKFLCSIKDYPFEKIELIESINELLNSGNIIDIDNYIEHFSSMISVFSNGRFALSLWDLSNNTTEKYIDHTNFTKYNNLSAAYPNLISKEFEDIELNKYKKLISERLNNGLPVNRDIVSYTTNGFYDGRSDVVIMTQTKSSIDKKRVEYYKNLISTGKRPYLLIYNRDITIDDLSNNYLIDGHHKFMAYLELDIEPVILEVTQMYEENLTLGEPLDFIEELYSWQAKHIFEKHYNTTDSIERILSHKTNFLNRFIKNGEISEYWENGELKSVATYRNNKVVGQSTNYFQNGQIKNIALHQEDGRVKRYIKSWFYTGELQSEYIPEPDYENGKSISYHRNSKVSCTSIFVNGKNKDGKTSICYHDNGNIQYEATYENGIIRSRKYYDRNGKLTEEMKR